MHDLRALAEKYVVLTGQIEEVRSAMLVCLTANGADANPHQPARRPGGGQATQHPKALAAQEVEAKILDLLRARPMRLAEIVTAMEARQSTTSERLRRLRQRGLVALVDGGAWAASG
jgi:hypothetical protein